MPQGRGIFHRSGEHFHFSPVQFLWDKVHGAPEAVKSLGNFIYIVYTQRKYAATVRAQELSIAPTPSVAILFAPLQAYLHKSSVAGCFVDLLEIANDGETCLWLVPGTARSSQKEGCNESPLARPWVQQTFPGSCRVGGPRYLHPKHDFEGVVRSRKTRPAFLCAS